MKRTNGRSAFLQLYLVACAAGIARATARERADRFKDAGAFADALDLAAGVAPGLPGVAAAAPGALALVKPRPHPI